jgi:AraC-like DNA-binding protein
MKIIKPEELKNHNLGVDVIDTYITEWKNGDHFSKYHKFKRPFSALFFVLSDMELDYIETNEDGEKIKRIHAKKGNILYIPSEIFYHCVFEVQEGVTKASTCTINFDLFDLNGEEVMLDDHILLLNNQVNRYMIEDLINIHKCSTNPIADDRLRVNSLYFSILHYATRVRPDGNRSNVIKKAVQAIENEWNRNEKMERYAALCNMSISRFYQEFHEYAGMSPTKYRNYIRINIAKSDLLNTNMKVKEIAEKVGFDDAFYFSRIFRNITGMSPKEFKKE